MTPQDYDTLTKTLKAIIAMRVPPRKINGIYGAKKWSEARKLFDERVTEEIIIYWTNILKNAKKKKSKSGYKKAKAFRHTQAEKDNSPRKGVKTS